MDGVELAKYQDIYHTHKVESVLQMDKWDRRTTKTWEIEGKGNILVSETKTTSRATVPAAEATATSAVSAATTTSSKAAAASTTAWATSKLDMNTRTGKK